MIKKNKLILLICLFLLSNKIVFSQQDTTHIADSLHNEILSEQSRQLQALEFERNADSVKRDDLQQQLSVLKTTDNVKKQELQKELDAIKNKDSLRIAQKKKKIDSLKTFVKGYAVVPFLKDTLFSIYNKVGSLSPKDRADAIDDRIKKLAGDYYFRPDSINIVANETTDDIVFGEMIIMSVSENDALWQNTTKEDLAAQYKTIIGNAIVYYKQQTSWQTIAKEVGLAIIVLVIVGALIYFIGKLFRLTKTKIIAQKGKLLKGVKIRNYELFDINRELNFFIGVNTFIKWVVIITAVYLAFPILFSIFPWTKNFASTLLAFLINPLRKIFHSLWDYLPNFFTILVIVIVFRYFLKFIHFLKYEVERGALKIPGFYADWANPTFQIIKVLIYAFMIVVIFPYLPGSNSPVFQGVSVFLGVLFTFGSSGSLSNIIAGLVLTYMRAFKIGDRVKIGDITGDIIEKTLLVTRIRTIKNEIISLPNSNIMSSHTINYSSDAVEKGLILHTTVTIGYDVPWRDMHRVLIDAAQKTEFILKEPTPFVLQTSLEDFYVSYQINAYTHEPNKQANIYSQLHQNIQDCANEAGIEIMSPHYFAARDGNQTTIPNDYLPKDYVTPGFKVDASANNKSTNT
ncbi:MAG: mechanosensitive ion channel domain-containing protein [Parafilimonas sp.]